MLASNQHHARYAALLLLVLATNAAHAAQGNPASFAWDAPHPPFHIVGNSWYVGSGGITVLLVRSGSDTVLFDTGPESALPVVRENLATLGVALRDVDLILTSHAHNDHVGALAAIKAESGARILATADSAALMAAGGLGDLHFGDRIPYPSVAVDDIVLDGETVELGELRFTARQTSGHTPGSTTWTWTERVDGREVHIVYADSLTAPGYRLLDHPQRPDLIEEFRASFATIRALPCDLLLTPHPQASQMFERLDVVAAAQVSGMKPVESGTCQRYAGRAEVALEQQIAQQRGALAGR